MTPHQMAKTQCDCYDSGHCLGITLNDQLNLVRFRPENSRCLLAEPIQRCSHFESCILPYKPDSKDSRTAAKLQAEWSEGSHSYRISTGYMAESIRLCPQCRKTKISNGRKLCDLCRAKNRRISKAKSDSTRNAESNSHSSSFSDVDTQ
jgi:hypothetical protein